MKRKFPVLLFLSLAVSTFLSAEGKYYSGIGYSGTASATYIGTVGEGYEPSDLNEDAMDYYVEHGYVITEVRKLTIEMKQLLYCSVSEYDFEDDEVYFIFAKPDSCYSDARDEGYCFAIATGDNGNSFRWYGFYYSLR